jgi:hypothetical protein
MVYDSISLIRQKPKPAAPFSVLAEQNPNLIQAIGMRSQNEGITLCKIPLGSDAFVSFFIDKSLSKLQLRFTSFKDLMPALLTLDGSLRRPTHHNF